MIKAVIFDVDGTLVDSVDAHARSWQDAFHEFGHDVELATLRSQIGKGGDQLLPVFLSADDQDATGDEIENRRAEILRDRYFSSIRPFPDVRPLFQRIIEDGKQIVLASSANSQELEKYKRLARIDDLLDAETSSDDADKSKPHPDIFEAALRKLCNIDASEAIVVGDTPYDAAAAKKAGLASIGVRCGGWLDEALQGAGCTAVYDDPSDLLARYDGSPLNK